jgi:hypothetical protein
MMTMEYEDVVRSITQTYWQSLLENDAIAREQAAELAQRYGFQPHAANTMIEEFSRLPLQEWLAQQSGTREPVILEETDADVEFSHQPYMSLVQQSGA